MILGQVENGLATVTLEVLDYAGSPRTIEAVLDTGYDGELTLPSRLIGDLQPRYGGNCRGALADGSTVVLTVYFATIIWHGHERETLIAQIKGSPLIGMALLDGSRVSIDVIEGGNVSIEELPDRP